MLAFKVLTPDPPYGTIFFWFSLFNDMLFIKWFTDCDEWFLYIGCKTRRKYHSIRFSSDGLTTH